MQTDRFAYGSGPYWQDYQYQKGQFMAPWDMRPVVEKVRMSGNDRVMLSERGSSLDTIPLW